MSTLRNNLVTQLYDEFAEMAYEECIQSIGRIAADSGYRIYPQVFVMGVDHDMAMNESPNLQIALIWTVSLLRQGDHMGAQAPLMMNSVIGGPIKQWLLTLLALTLGRVEFQDAVKSSETDEQTLQAHYYEGERLVNERSWQDALQRFEICAALPGSCPEKGFAKARMEWLRGKAGV